MEEQQVETPKLSLAEEMRQAAKSQMEGVIDHAVQQQETQEADEGQKEEIVEDSGEIDEVAKQTDEEFPLIPNDLSDEEKEIFQRGLESEDEEVRLMAELYLSKYNNLKKGFYTKANELAEIRKANEAIDSLFKPYDQMMQQNGMDRAQYMQNMIMWEQALAQKPLETVKAIMEKYGVRPEQINNGLDFNEDFDDNDDNKLNSMQEHISKLEKQIANQPVLAQIESFKTATDSQGNLKHPKFEEVAPVMGTLIQTGKAKTLDDAYAKAIRAVASEESSDSTQNSAVDLDQLRQKIAQSKRAGKTVKTSGTRLDYSKMSLRDELAARLKS